jgi:gamma-tubulin complex component 3
VPESVLIRDIIYILQGINGQYVRFKSPSPARVGPRRPYARGAIVVEEVEESVQASFEDGIEFVLDGSGYSIPAPTRALLHELSELGWLYRKIDQAVNVDGEEQRAGRVIGMVEQSLHAALKDEMTEYYRLVAVLEGQWEEGEEATVLGLEGGLTLRRLVVWTADVRLRVRMMGTLVEEAGGESLSSFS